VTAFVARSQVRTAATTPATSAP